MSKLPETVIITRHGGLLTWLAREGIFGRVIDHATAEDVRGKRVIGALPFHLACLAASVEVVDMPDLRPDQRGQDLSADEMDTAGARLTRYVVREA